MTTWFTSDTHFGHARIVELCGRPFTDAPNMNEVIIHNWNAIVRPDDTVYHLGDLAMGPIQESLELIRRLNGRKILIVGNHDRPFPPFQKGRVEKIAEWTERYKAAGLDEVHQSLRLSIGGWYNFNLSHFPYSGDSSEESRYSEYRLRDDGTPVIHGHTHSKSKFTRSQLGTPQIHVGVDAWDFAPVSLQAVIDTLERHGADDHE